ncbi:hypothetical protein HDV00_005526 [Rhizophlyctis rosea]|nr:hypothetical protein HDV00_005526 [Rhizophlyctis rosea]
MLKISIPTTRHTIPILSPITPITPTFNTPSLLSFPAHEERIEAQSASLFRKVRDALDAAAVRSVVDFYRALLEVGEKGADGTVVVDRKGLGGVLGKWDVGGTEQELDAVFEKFQRDEDDSQSLPIGDFVRSIKGSLPPKRLDLVRDVYRSILGSTGRDVVLLKDAKQRYNALAHPRVQSGELDSEKVLFDFIQYWSKDRPNGAIELIEWEVYFSTISANIERDQYFEKLMTQCWPGITPATEPPPPKLNPQTKRLLTTRIRNLTFLISDPRIFRTCLDLCMLRHPPPPNIPRPFAYPDYLRLIVGEMFKCVHDNLDDDAFNLIQKRMVKELGMNGFATAGMAELEGALRAAMRKELGFLEYQIHAKTADK